MKDITRSGHLKDVGTLQRVMDRVASSARVADYVAGKLTDKHLDLLIERLMEVGTGICIERINIHKGVEYKNLYFQPPDVRAIEAAFRIAGVYVSDATKPIMEMAQAQQAVMEGEAGLATARVALMESQARMNNEQSDLFPKRFVTEEQEKADLLEIVEIWARYIVSLTPDQWAAMDRGEQGLQAFKERVALGYNEAIDKINSLHGRDTGDDTPPSDDFGDDEDGDEG